RPRGRQSRGTAKCPTHCSRRRDRSDTHRSVRQRLQCPPLRVVRDQRFRGPSAASPPWQPTLYNSCCLLLSAYFIAFTLFSVLLAPIRFRPDSDQIRVCFFGTARVKCGPPNQIARLVRLRSPHVKRNRLASCGIYDLLVSLFLKKMGHFIPLHLTASRRGECLTPTNSRFSPAVLALERRLRDGPPP